MEILCFLFFLLGMLVLFATVVIAKETSRNRGDRLLAAQVQIQTQARLGVEVEFPRMLIPMPRPTLGEITVSHTWLTDTVVAIAKDIKETKDYSAAPILADALQDAGCNDENVLVALRNPDKIRYFSVSLPPRWMKKYVDADHIVNSIVSHIALFKMLGED